MLLKSSEKQKDLLNEIVAMVDAYENKTSSVLQDWVMRLPLRQQGTLLTAIRGCDLTPKYPLDSTERNVTAFIRYSVMTPFDVREIDYTSGCFMQSRIDFDIFRPSAFGHYPNHFVMHLIHALEVIAYQSDSELCSNDALRAYQMFVKSLHLHIETPNQMEARLNEDRISLNNVIE